MGRQNDHIYIQNNDEIYDSLIEFNEKPEFWRSILSSAPKYFVHLEKEGIHYFALSKFCVFKNILAEDYIKTFRYKTDGGTAKNVIRNRCKKNWIPYNDASISTQQAFTQWIGTFFPAYAPNNASFLTLNNSGKSKIKSKNITPERLKEILEVQSEIGKIGEEIAYEFEIERLASLGIKNSKQYVHHESLINSASGFDIFSKTKKETRYIEVKSSTFGNQEFFLSENELKTLEVLSSESYLYIVHITDFKKRKGVVTLTINNPIERLLAEELLRPIAYKVSLNGFK